MWKNTGLSRSDRNIQFVHFLEEADNTAKPDEYYDTRQQYQQVRSRRSKWAIREYFLGRVHPYFLPKLIEVQHICLLESFVSDSGPDVCVVKKLVRVYLR